MSPNFNLFNSTTQIPEDSNLHDQNFLMCAIHQRKSSATYWQPTRVIDNKNL